MYKPNGTALNDYEREVLVLVMEECAEVIQAASKLIRFGKENRPDNDVSNTVTLSRELGDLKCVVNMAMQAGLLEPVAINEGVRRKTERLAFYMQHKKPK